MTKAKRKKLTVEIGFYGIPLWSSGPGGKMPESKWELGDFYNEGKLSTKSQITTISGWRQGYSQSKILVSACASVGEGTGTPP